MSCISSNFSSFFLNSLNDPSEFSKYLSNGELKCTNFEEFQVFAQSTQQQQQQVQQQHQQQYSHTNGVGSVESVYETPIPLLSQREAAETPAVSATTTAQPLLNNRWPTAVATPNGHVPATAAASSAQHFDGSFEFIKYLRHSTDFTPGTTSGVGDGVDSAATADKGNKLTTAGKVTPPLLPASPVGASGGLLDLDSTSSSQKSRSASRKVAALLSSVSRSSNSLDASSSALDAVFDHDSKQAIFELQHLTSTSNGSNGSNSNESSQELLAFPSSHLNASNSNTSSEEHCGSAGEFGGLLSGVSCSSASAPGASPKLLGSFVIKENFEVHPSHKVEEGIFQHMNKLPSKKKDTLKQLGVRFTGQMTLTDKSIVVENFIKFCEEYDIKDHRPWLSLNQCGLNKPEQIKFARYLGQGLPTFTLFCIYSNFKNLFCTKRTEIYTKDGYNLPYILDKTKRFLANTTAGENTNTNNNSSKTNNITTTTTSTPIKQTLEQGESAPSSPAAATPTATMPTPNSSNNNNSNSNTHATGISSTHLHTQQAAQSQPHSQPSTVATGTATRTMTPTGTPLPRPGTPTTPALAAGVTPTTPHPQQHQHLHQQHGPHHLQQQQQQQQPSTPTRCSPLNPQHHHQQQHSQHTHLSATHPHHYSHTNPQQHSHPHTHTQQHPLSHPHPQQHAHSHHFAYAHSHHTHYGLSPHPHQHSHPHPHAHMAVGMGYGQQVVQPAPSSSAQPPPQLPPNLKNMAAANDGTLEFTSNSSSSSNSNNNNINNNSSSSVNSNSSSSNSIGLSSSYLTTAAPPSLDTRYGCVKASSVPLLPPPSLPIALQTLGPPPRSLEQLIIYENFNVHETHRIEDGVCTHISRLPPKKQELLKQFGIQSSSQQCLSNYEKCILIENFIKFCNEYQISDHRPFLDFHESALSKCEQLKFVRYLGQGLSNLTLNKIYVAFKDLLGNGRSDKSGPDSYSLDALLKKKRKNLYNRLHAAATSVDLTTFDSSQPTQQHSTASRPHHAFAALAASSQRSEVCNDLTQYSYVSR